MPPVIQGIVTILVGVSGCIAYFWVSNWLLDRVIFPARGPNAGRNINRANLVRPWLFMFPAIFVLGLYLAYPVLGSFVRSLYNRAGTEFIWFGNYIDLFASGTFRTAVFNNFLWLLVVPAGATFFGLMAAQLTDRLS